MQEYLEWNHSKKKKKNQNLGMPLVWYLEENLYFKCLIFPLFSNIRSWVYNDNCIYLETWLKGTHS